jgi:HD-like signal output (HDOD) protein/CheY-like chemotaxis protein
MTEALRVLFVDDEDHILRGLRRSMACMGGEWDMAFCTSGEQALDLMRTEPAFDVVVSDMRMPRMDGAVFLDAVRQRHPETIRVILSGYADTESIFRTVGPAHVYLAKPCSPEALHQAISRPVSLKRLLSAPALRAVLAGLSNLPSLPEIVLRLDEELRSPQCSPKAVAALIDGDVAMTAELLRLTNSAYFSVAGPVSTTLQAVRAIGLEIVRALVLQIGIFRQFSGNAALAPVLERLTGHCLTVAGLAEAIAGSMETGEAVAKTAHCAAMLSRIGMLVLLDAYPEAYGEALARVAPGRPLSLVEEETFGASHALVGAYLLGLWGFSPQVVEAVAFAAEPSRCSGHDNDVLTALHAATSLGPSLAGVLALGVPVSGGLDLAYLAEARRDGLISRWRRLAAGPSGEVR